MTLNAKARIVSATILGAILGFFVHLQDLHRFELGREGFLAKEAVRFDNHLTKTAHSPFGTTVAGVLIAVAALAVYEGLTFLIAKLLRKGVGNSDGSWRGP